MSEPLPTTQLLRKVRRIKVASLRAVDELFAGRYHSVFRGTGVEFSEVREYEEGDDLRAMHWPLTARLGRPVVKRYVEERELTLLLFVDVSASMGCGAVRPKSELATELGALFALSAVRNADRVGLLCFSDRIVKYVPPRKDVRHALRVIRELVAVVPGGGPTDVAGALSFAARLLRRRCVAVVISDFLSEGWERRLVAFAARHDLIALVVRDPADHRLPRRGAAAVVDSETGWAVEADLGRLSSRLAAASRRFDGELAARLRGIDWTFVHTDSPYMESVARLLARRARRLRRGT